MNELGKGIGIGLTAIAIAYAAVELKNPYVCWAFLVLVGMACDWKTTCDKEDDDE